MEEVRKVSFRSTSQQLTDRRSVLAVNRTRPAGCESAVSLRHVADSVKNVS